MERHTLHMGYFLQALIGQQKVLDILTTKYDKASIIYLEQGLFLVPMTEELLLQLDNLYESNSIDQFEYLTEKMERNILSLIDGKELAYIEAEYHGGEGGQMAVIWRDGKRLIHLDYSQNRINEVLKHFGVIAEDNMDEFETLRLGRYRNTSKWLNETNRN